MATSISSTQNTSQTPVSLAEVGLVIGIDATNLRLGGGVTHLIELLSAANPIEHGILRVVVWGAPATLSRLPQKSWITQCSPAQLKGSLVARVLWQIFGLSREARKMGCDILFIPGGSYAGTFHPVVTMSQNLLPFEWREIRRSGFSNASLKMFLLRVVQSWSFHRSEGVIFLTDYAKNAVLKVVGSLRANTVVIAHGLSKQFEFANKMPREISECSVEDPFKLIYVSSVDAYKHQLTVLKAVQQLRQKGYPLSISFIGPGVSHFVDKLNRTIAQFDPQRRWARYLGQVPYEQLQTYYANADLGVFASSCETFGIILLEKMATGLPIVCSNLSSMREILQDGGAYFNPEKEGEIARAIEQYLLSATLQLNNRSISYALAQEYSWERCARETFGFLRNVALAYQGKFGIKKLHRSSS